MKLKFITTFALIFIFFLFFLANNTHAKCIAINFDSTDDYNTCRVLGETNCKENNLCDWKQPKSGDSTETVTLKNPLSGTPDINTFIGKVINGALGIVGSLALAMFIYGGFMWMLSAGNSEMVTKGKNTLVWAAIGLVIVFSAYAITKFILDSITGAG